MRRKGFTLIELLIVIAILGILVALILPRFSDVRDDANTKVCIGNLRGLSSAMATYETKENIDGAWGTGPWTIAHMVDWKFIATVPFCPLDSGSTGYTLHPDDATHPDYATCPEKPATHVWP